MALQNSVTTKIQYISWVINSQNIIIHPIQSIHKTPFSIFIQSNATKILQISAQKFFSILQYIKAKCQAGPRCPSVRTVPACILDATTRTDSQPYPRGGTVHCLQHLCHSAAGAPQKVFSGFRECVCIPKGKGIQFYSRLQSSLNQQERSSAGSLLFPLRLRPTSFEMLVLNEP